MNSNNKNSLVVRSNRLIEAQYRLSKTELQLILLAINISRETQNGLSVGVPLTITVSAFADMYAQGLCGSLYDNVRDAAKSLFHRFLTINTTNPATGARWDVLIRWVTSVAYSDGEAAVKLVFSPDIVPYISQLESEFTIVRLQQIGDLSSVYAVRIYELLFQFKSLGSRSFDISDLRKILGLSDEYKLFGDLKRNVIDISVAQINEHTDIKVKYETRKTGRKITHLDFKIKEKSEAPKRLIINDDLIKKHARPGETTEQVRERLRKERDAKTSTQPR
jgi:plasmid replication initiation protein